MYDLIVVGGGLSGTAAAIAASRCGMKVLLAEQHGFLGGAATVCGVNPFMAYWTEKDGVRCDLSCGIFSEIKEELIKYTKKYFMAYDQLDETYFGKHFHGEHLKIILENMAQTAGVKLMYHSTLSGVKAENGKIKSVSFVFGGNTYEFESRYFIDATGDANLAHMAGCPYSVGREEDGICQPMTLSFDIGNVDVKKFWAEGAEVMNSILAEKKKQGEIDIPRNTLLVFTTLVSGVMHLNSTRVSRKNPLDPFDITDAEIDARNQMMQIYEFMKKNIAGFEKSELLFSGPDIGVRESRMIKGDYTLTADDLLTCKKFDDSVAAGNYDIDIHSPDGGGTYIKSIPTGDYYTIPYRCMIPQNTENLLVAGRSISATHEAQSSVRIMPICCCMGEAAGIAVFVANKDKCGVREGDISLIRKLLKQNGALI